VEEQNRGKEIENRKAGIEQTEKNCGCKELGRSSKTTEGLGAKR
jgi:hypothetical protein